MGDDITNIKTHEGWLHLRDVIEMFSRRVVDRTAQRRVTTELALKAQLMAVWRSNPAGKVMIHSDQGTQFTSWEWQTLLRKHNLKSSMSRRVNCRDNAVAESFLQLLKRKRARRRTYPTRDDVRRVMFEYIGNPAIFRGVRQ